MSITQRLGVVVLAVGAGAILGALPAQADGIGTQPPPDHFHTDFVVKLAADGRGCSGSLISSEWVVTAASCFPEIPQGGAPVKATTVTDATATAHVTTVVTRGDRDLALAKIDPPIIGRTTVQLASRTPAVGTALVGDGFGRTATEWVPDRQHSRGFTINTATDATYSLTNGDGLDNCKGDAGGPLYQSNGAFGFELVGVHSTSRQHGCLGETTTQQGDLDARADDIVDWIRQNAPFNPDLDQARGKTVIASSTHEGDGWGTAKLLDGQTTTTPESAGWSSENSLGVNHTESVTIDLQLNSGTMPLSRIDLYPRTDAIGYGFPVDFTVDTSPDGKNWTTAAARTNFPKPTTAGAIELPLNGVQAGFVRVTGTNLRTDPQGTYRMQFAELGLVRANLATGKALTASSVASDTDWQLGFAVDGSRSKSGGGGDGWTSQSGPAGRTEWLQIDFGGQLPVGRIDLYPRGDEPSGSKGFPSTVTIEGSNDGQTWTPVASGSGTLIAGTPAAKTFSFAGSDHRYLRISGTGFQADEHGDFYLQFGEVEAWAPNAVS